MKVVFMCDPDAAEPRIAVIARAEDERTRTLYEKLSRMYDDTLKGYDGDRVALLSPSDVIRVFAEGNKVLAQTGTGTYQLRARLYELEEQLGNEEFIRISKCELINRNRVLRLDVSLGGTVGVEMEGNIRTYTSRRYMKHIKEVLGLTKSERR